MIHCWYQKCQKQYTITTWSYFEKTASRWDVENDLLYLLNVQPIYHGILCIWKNEHRIFPGLQSQFIDVMAVIFNLTTLQSVAAPGNDFI